MLLNRPLALGIILMLVAVTAGLWWPWLAARILYAPVITPLLEAISGDPILLEAVRDQNRRLAHVSEAYIRAVDEAWTAEKNGGELAATMLDTSASRRLRELLGATRGVVRHAILMDARGLNVAIAYPTTDYFQGDESKWLMTFGRPSATRHKGAVETGHDGTFPSCWVSAPLNEPNTKDPIGAISLEVNALLVRDTWCNRD
jgi:hypothetical protein